MIVQEFTDEGKAMSTTLIGLTLCYCAKLGQRHANS